MNTLDYVPKEHLSPSSSCVFTRCPRRYFYKCGLCLERGEGTHPALTFGSGIHAALPAAWRGDLDAGMAAFYEEWGETEGDDKRNPQTARRLLKDYISSHEGEKALFKPVPPPTGRLLQEKTGEFEIPFALDVGLPRVVVGRIDALVRHRDSGLLWGYEYKTTSRLGAGFLTGFHLSPQVLTYTLALKVLTGEKIEGCFVEASSVAKTVTKTLCHPINVRFTSLEGIIAWYQKVYSGISACEMAEEWPCDYSGCNSYNGFGMSGFTCEYEPLCEAGEGEENLRGMFTRREPQPFTTSNPETEGVKNENTAKI